MTVMTEERDRAFRQLIDGSGGWPVLPAHKRPPFPVDALPRDVARFVSAIAEESQTPADLAALSALSVLSAAAMGSAVVDCGTWHEEMCLYVLIAMPSGDRKSTVLRAADEPLRELERKRREDSGPGIREKRSERETLEARRNRLIKEIASPNPNAREPREPKILEGELVTTDEKLAEIGDPVAPRLLADDATAEALGGLLARHDEIAVIAAESALIDNLLGRYGEGGPNLHLVCRAYSGESHVIDRKGHDPQEIERPLMTVGLAVQPHVLDKLCQNNVARSQGLVGRFAYARPQTQLGRRKIDSEPMPVDVRRGWATVVNRIFADKTDKTPAEQAEGLGGSVSSVSKIHNAISLSPGASGALKELRQELEPRLGEDGDLHSVSDWISRHHGRVARIAGLLHLVEHDARDPISEATMRSALRIGEYLLAHGLLALTESDPLTGRALRWLAHHGQAVVTQRELHRGVLSHGKAEEAAALLGELVELGALRVRASGEDPNNGRPPSTEYYVNPKLLSR